MKHPRAVAFVTLALSLLTLASCAAPADATPRPAETPAPSESPTETAPLPAETTWRHGRWAFTLGPVEWNQRERVLAANRSPGNPPAGYGWAIIRLNVTNIGDVEAVPGMFEVVLHSGGWDVSHLTESKYLYRMPDAFDAHDIETGESLSGNLGFWVPDYASSDKDCRVELRARNAYYDDPVSTWFTCDR